MQQFKRSFWQLLFFLTLALLLITLAFIKRPKFQSSLTVTTARVWGYAAPIASNNLNAFKNDEVVKGVFGILNKLFSDKKSVVSLFIHNFLLNKTNLAKSQFRKHFIYSNSKNIESPKRFTISNNARTQGLWSREGERALMTPNFKLSSLTPAQKDEDWLFWLRGLVNVMSVFDGDFAGSNKGAFNLQKTRTNIRNLFVGWVEGEMKVQLKIEQGLFAKGLVVLLEEMKVQLKGEQKPRGDSVGPQGLKGADGKDGTKGNKGDQGSRGPAGQNGQVEKEAVIGLSIALGVFFCLFLAYVMVIHQKRIFSIFKSRKKSTKI